MSQPADTPPPISGRDFKGEPGWQGYFTRYQAEGAIPNGTRVAKVKSEPGDAHPVGSMATVLGSIPRLEDMPHIFYFVEWDDLPGNAIGIVAWKIAPAQKDRPQDTETE